MNPLQRYIAEEIATDHVDGLLPRREALRRLSLLGVGTAAATVLFTACAQRARENPTPVPPAQPGPSSSGSSTAAPATTTDAPDPAAPGAAAALPTEAITWSGPGGEAKGAFAAAATPRGAVLVVHENRGLTEHIRGLAGRFAGIGYSALAVDLLSPAGTDSYTDSAEATAALGRTAPEQHLAGVRSGLDELTRRVPGVRTAAVGFCFGGGMVWRLLAAGEPRLAAAFPFYGPAPENPDFAGSKQAAVLGFYAQRDDRVNATEPVARAALERAGLVHELVTEPNAEHAFFNDTGARYDPTAAADAWRRVGDWLAVHVD